MTKREQGNIMFVVAAVSAAYGILAQLGEHLPYKQRVIGSSPIVPTKQRNTQTGVFLFGEIK